MRTSPNKQTIIIIILVILLLLVVGYFGIGQYSKTREQKQITLLQQGAQIGYTQAELQLYNEAVKCNQVPVTIQNQTINVIAVECLQALARQQQQG